MRRESNLRSRAGIAIACGMLAAAAFLLLLKGGAADTRMDAASRVAALRASSQRANLMATGEPQLIAVQKLPEMAGEMCQWEPASASQVREDFLAEMESGASGLARGRIFYGCRHGLTA